MKLRVWLLATSAVLATSAAEAEVTANSLYIYGAQPQTLTISQDSSNIGGNNSIGTLASKFTLSGAMNSIAITQSGKSNSLVGSVKVRSDNINSVSNLTQVYGGAGYNTATVNIGANASPAALSGNIEFTNTGSSSAQANIFNETADTSGVLSYDIDVEGNTNLLTDVLSATGDIYNTQEIYGNSNIVDNSITAASSITLANSIQTAANSNRIETRSTGSGAKTVNNTISQTAGSSQVFTHFNNVAGSQYSMLEVLGGAVNFDLDSKAPSTTSKVHLMGVMGESYGAAVRVGVSQTANAVGANTELTVSGNGFSAGAISGTGIGGSYGVYVLQNTPAAVTNASFTAMGNGYTALISQ